MKKNVFSPQLLLGFAVSNAGSLSYCSFFPPRLQNWRSKAACQKVTMTTRSMTLRWMTRGKKITQKSVRQSCLHVQFNRKKQVFAGGLICCCLFFFTHLAGSAGEGGWGAVAGWGRVALSLNLMIWRWTLTPRFPAQRTSSARPNRSPRISRSCCELLRRTNMTGQNEMKGFCFFYQFCIWFIYICVCFLNFRFLALILNLKFLLHS